jgi:two-component system KDP operon response regulator KdpE
VPTLGTAVSGLHAAVDSPPDIILLDLGLPDMDGRGLLRMAGCGGR